MKKGTLAGILLAAAAILALGLLAAYLTLQNKNELFSGHASRTESEAEAVLATLRGTQESETGTQVLPDGASEGRVPGLYSADGSGSSNALSGQASVQIPDDFFAIWVGDSRTLGMEEAMDNDDLYIGAAGEGYNWFSESGLPLLKDALKEYPDAPVVFNFGVNDYDNMENYLNLYTSLTEEYPDTHFYFLAVYPIDPELCENITNEEISDFNSHLRELFPDTYLDSYTQIMMRELRPFDGIHYEKDAYRSIYEFAAQQILRRESEGAS